MTEVRSSFSRRGEYEDGRKHLALVPGQKGKDFKIEFDLQSLGVTPAGKEFSALRDCALSVRTPNIEKEVSSVLFRYVANFLGLELMFALS